MKKNLHLYLQLIKLSCFAIAFGWFFPLNLSAQFTPITTTGFNHDVVAETGNSSLTTTTLQLDGGSSNKVMYSNTFRIANGFGGGGIPDNGIITDASGTYQLAPYNSNNALLLQRAQNGDLTLSTPARFSRIRVLCFSTEGTSLVNATLFFSDGTSAFGVTNYSLSDWFNGTTNLVMSGFGRCTRATPTGPADAFPTNPRFYYIEFILSCANQQKNLQRINFSNVTTAGTNAPFPNLVIWAISGRSYAQTITSAITHANCVSGGVGNGSAALTVTGTSSPYTYSWNTVPVQTNATATNLLPGNYIATITDANGCVTTYPVTISFFNPIIWSLTKTDVTCNSNGSITVNGLAPGSYEFSINGGVTFQTSNVFSNLAPGTYTIIARHIIPGVCTMSQAITVGVINNLTVNSQSPTSICRGGSVIPAFVSNATTLSWSPSTGVSNPSILNPIFNPTSTTSYTITATLGTCSATQSYTVNVFSGVTANAGPDVTIIAGDTYQLQGSGTTGTYLWTPSTGLSVTNILDPNATPATTTTYNLRVTNAQGCFATDDVTITVIPYCVKVMEAFTPNGDGINDRWLVTNGNCATNLRASVFNRYGSKVFESTNYNNNWDGVYEGKPLPDGAYYYTIEFNLLNGRRVILKGNLTILR